MGDRGIWLVGFFVGGGGWGDVTMSWVATFSRKALEMLNVHISV